jgi:hypothetical protein
VSGHRSLTIPMSFPSSKDAHTLRFSASTSIAPGLQGKKEPQRAFPPP